MAEDTNAAANNTSGEDGNKAQAADKGADTGAATQTQDGDKGTNDKAGDTANTNKSTDTSTTDKSAADMKAALKAIEEKYGVKVYTEQEHNGHMGSARRGWASTETELKGKVGELETQLEKVTTERNELAGKIRFTNLVSAAVEAQAKYPDVVAKLVPDDVKDDAASLKAFYQKTRQEKPDLFTSTSADGGSGNGIVSSRSVNDWIRSH